MYYGILFLAGVALGPWGMGWWGVYAPAISLAPSIVFGNLPALPCAMVLSCRLVAVMDYSDLWGRGGMSGGALGEIYALVGLSSVVLGLSRLKVGC